MPRGEPRKALNVRVAPELKRQIEQYAGEVGLPINSAVIVLLIEGLRTEREKTTR